MQPTRAGSASLRWAATDEVRAEGQEEIGQPKCGATRPGSNATSTGPHVYPHDRPPNSCRANHSMIALQLEVVARQIFVLSSLASGRSLVIGPSNSKSRSRPAHPSCWPSVGRRSGPCGRRLTHQRHSEAHAGCIRLVTLHLRYETAAALRFGARRG